MVAIRQFESLLELKLQGLGSPEIVSITAELIVAALLFGGIAGTVTGTGWLLKRVARRTVSH